MPRYCIPLLILLWCSIISAVALDAPLKRHTFAHIRKQPIKTVLLSNEHTAKEGYNKNIKVAEGHWMPPRVEVFHETLKNNFKHCNYDKYEYKENVTDLLGGTETCTPSTVMDYWGGNFVYRKKLHTLLHVAVPKLVSYLQKHTLIKQLSKSAHPIDLANTRICPHFVIPKEHATTGVSDADIVIHITATPFPKGFPLKRVWAYTCRVRRDQPIVLVINYNPEYILHTGIEEYSFKEVQKALRLTDCPSPGRSLIWSEGMLDELHFHNKCVRVGCEHDSDNEEKSLRYYKDDKWVKCGDKNAKKSFYYPFDAQCPIMSEFCHHNRKGW